MTVEFFDVTIETDSATVFLAGVVTGVVALFAFVAAPHGHASLAATPRGGS